MPKYGTLTEDAYQSNQRFFRRAAGIASILRYLERSTPINWNSKRVLELGCGSGAGLWTLQVTGANPVGIDPQEKGYSMYARNDLVDDIPYYEETSETFLQRQSDQSYEVVCAFDTVSDVWTPTVSEHVYRVLLPNGLIIITWQDVNLTSERGEWPQGWPIWRGKRYFFPLRQPSNSVGRRWTYIRELVRPRSISEGRVEIDPILTDDDMVFPETESMVGTK